MEEYEEDSRKVLSEDEMNILIEQLCHSKSEEFILIGYENVTGREVWACVNDKYKEGLPPLHRVVNDILSLKITTLMNWMTLNAYKGIQY